MSDAIASPSTRRFAHERGVDIGALARETGREVVSRSDVERKLSGGDGTATAPPPAAPSAWEVDHARYGPVETEPISRLNQLAAANLAAAQSHIPAVTHHDAADLTALEAFRRSLRDEAAARGVRLTTLAFHVKALARTLGAFPRFNAALAPDGKTLVLKRYVDIGIAVDTEHGLMVPVVRGADGLGLWAIAGAIGDLAARAQARKLRAEDMGGASMTITNLGGIGGRAFSPIVNPPEVAILGITRARMEPVWTGEAFEPRETCPLDLSYDHRVINGADAARFLAHYARLIGDPRRMLI